MSRTGLRESYTGLHKCLMLHCNLTCKRQREGKAGPLAVRAFHPDPAAEEFDDPPADMQAEAAAVGLAGGRAARLAELVEDQRPDPRLDARAVVAHVDAQAVVRLA